MRDYVKVSIRQSWPSILRCWMQHLHNLSKHLFHPITVPDFSHIHFVLSHCYEETLHAEINVDDGVVPAFDVHTCFCNQHDVLRSSLDAFDTCFSSITIIMAPIPLTPYLVSMNCSIFWKYRLHRSFVGPQEHYPSLYLKSRKTERPQISERLSLF